MIFHRLISTNASQVGYVNSSLCQQTVWLGVLGLHRLESLWAQRTVLPRFGQSIHQLQIYCSGKAHSRENDVLIH